MASTTVALALPATHALIPFEETAASARRYARAGKAPGTIEGYRKDFAAFSRWCTERGLSALPAETATVILHVSDLADVGLSVSSIGRRVAAIAYSHKLGRAPDDLREVLAGIRRTVGAAPRNRKAAATPDFVGTMLAACPDTLIGLRDRALIALGFAGAFRRSELAALLVSDLTEVGDGYRVMIRRSKTDQEGQGVEIAIPRGYRLRPVEAVQAWLAASGITGGPLSARCSKAVGSSRGRWTAAISRGW